MSVKGTPQLRARMRAIKQTFKPVGKAWATDTVHLAQARVAVRTHKTQRSIRVKNASMKRATVAASFVASFIDKGTKAHEEKAKNHTYMRGSATGTIFAPGAKVSYAEGARFAKKVHKPAVPARPFIQRAAEEALRKNPMAAELIALWNSAA